MVLKPIETSYAGYKFRSRLEARWGVFLDHLRVPWEYEIEGFDLADVPQVAVPLTGKDAWYLPDFWLPEQNTWLEIKPIAPSVVEQERAGRLSIAAKKAAVLVIGQPWIVAEHPDGYDGADSGLYFSPTNGRPSEFHLLTACPFCGQVGWCRKGFAHLLPCDCPNEPATVGDFGRVQRAYLAARRARFEHGETPTGQGGL